MALGEHYTRFTYGFDDCFGGGAFLCVARKKQVGVYAFAVCVLLPVGAVNIQHWLAHFPWLPATATSFCYGVIQQEAETQI